MNVWALTILPILFGMGYVWSLRREEKRRVVVDEQLRTLERYVESLQVEILQLRTRHEDHHYDTLTRLLRVEHPKPPLIVAKPRPTSFERILNDNDE